MRKIDNQIVTQLNPVSVHHPEQVTVLVPYDSNTGTVYLNACGQDESEACHALSAIDLNEDEWEAVRLVEAKIDFSEDAKLLSNLFPVAVPINTHTGKPLLLGIGHNLREAEANLAFANGDEEAHHFIWGMMQMPAPSLNPGSPLRQLPVPGP